MKKENHNKDTFLTRRITNEDIYKELQEIKVCVKSQKWHNKAFYTGITLLATGFVLLWGKV